MNKKIIFIISAILFLSGCATYKVQKGRAPYDQGYVYSRYNKIIPEYTIGTNNSVPDKQIAEERFKRRRKTVEYYYKKLGYIENRFKGMFVDPPAFLVETIFGLFRMPVIAVRDYKYNHNPKYKEKVDQFDEAEYKAEKKHIRELKEELNTYIQEDLKKESAVTGGPIASAPAKVLAPEPIPTPLPESVPAQSPTPILESVSEPVKTLAPEQASAPVPALTTASAPASTSSQTLPVVSTPSVEFKDKEKPVSAVEVKPEVSYFAPVAVITAKPVKGPSPLTVKFSADKSRSPKARIVSYSWDFGDGDTSTKKNPTNIYWSASYGPRVFTVTLTVTDNVGQSGSTSANIEVITE